MDLWWTRLPKKNIEWIIRGRFWGGTAKRRFVPEASREYHWKETAIVLCVAGVRWYEDKDGDKYGGNADLGLWDPGLQGAGGGH